ncbi:flavoprotein [Lentzea sp. NPDC055074]
MTTSEKAKKPDFGARAVLVVGTGAISAMHLPFWLNWLRLSYPDTEIQVALTRSAEAFVSRHSLTALTRREVIRDRWPEEPEPAALHVRLAEWAEAVLVYPACVNFLARLSLGLADTPVLMALQCTSAPIGLAPALPPGAAANPAVVRNLAELSERTNVVVAPTKPSRSLTTGRTDADGLVPLWDLITRVEERRLLFSQVQEDTCSS